MQKFTQNRDKNTQDELWITQHLSVFTQGISATNDILAQTNIPIIKTDRGGKTTYHGEGQLIIYLLIDLQRLKLGIKKFVYLIEQAVINLLADYQINANRRVNMPGVYVNDYKICALGLKIKNHKTYHGLSLNIDMDLSPFNYINVCGYQALKVSQVQDYVSQKVDIKNLSKKLTRYIIALINKQ